MAQIYYILCLILGNLHAVINGYLHVYVWSELVQDRLRSIVQELIRVRHIVHVDFDSRLDGGIRPPAKRLAPESQCDPVVNY